MTGLHFLASVTPLLYCRLGLDALSLKYMKVGEWSQLLVGVTRLLYRRLGL